MYPHRVVPLLAAVCFAVAGGTGVAAARSEPRGSVASRGAAAASSVVVVTSRTIKGLGPVLVNARGLTLYTFAPDRRRKVTCVGSCAVVWPPDTLTKGQKLLGKGAVRQSLLGSDQGGPHGSAVVTYAGWPLYTYVADARPGDANGQALNSTGGYWYVISPQGIVIRKHA